MLVNYITDNIPIPYDEYVRIEDVEPSLYEINQDIRMVENRISAMLIKRDFEVQDFIEDREYLMTLYEIRGSLYTLNSILSENKNIQMIYS